MKINFTKENETELRSLIADSVLRNDGYKGPMGQVYTVVDLVSNLTVNSLRTLLQSVRTKISKLSVEDEWVDNPNAEELDKLNTSSRLINLIIGWKLYQSELVDRQMEKEKLESKLDDLIKAQRTPEEIMSELRDRIAELS